MRRGGGRGVERERKAGGEGSRRGGVGGVDSPVNVSFDSPLYSCDKGCVIIAHVIQVVLGRLWRFSKACKFP